MPEKDIMEGLMANRMPLGLMFGFFILAQLFGMAVTTLFDDAGVRAIEEEDFVATPAPVYLRGFIKTVARELKLNPQQVASRYMERYEEATGEG